MKMLQSTVVIAVVLALAIAEPPIDNRYLPPGQRLNGGFGSPSQNYGPPEAARFSPQRQTEAVFGSVSPNYNAPRSRPSSTYGAPRNSRPSNQYLPPSSQPSSQYGPPNSRFGSRNSPSQFGANPPSNQYGAPQRNNPSQIGSQQRNAPSSQYGVPSQFGPERFNAASQFAPQSNPSPQYLPPSGQYGAPNEEEFGLQRRPSEQFRAPMPSSEYGAPGYDNTVGGQQSNFGSYEDEQSRQYQPPGGGAGYPGARGYAGDDEGSNEPANYSFEYMVKDDASGNDFGHRESRMGDRAEGLYYVLLPDGRKQTVQYEADQDGYKPRISYEDIGSGAGGYDRNSQARSQGGPY